MRERLARLDLAVEGQEGRTQRVVELGIGHHHVEDRLRVRLDAAPHIHGLEQTPCRSRDRRRARIARRPAKRRIGDGHAEMPLPSP